MKPNFKTHSDYINQNEQVHLRCRELSIGEPPCEQCRFFNPRIKTTKNGTFDGVIICHSDEMHHDFSCYEPRIQIQDIMTKVVNKI